MTLFSAVMMFMIMVGWAGVRLHPYLAAWIGYAGLAICIRTGAKCFPEFIHVIF